MAASDHTALQRAVFEALTTNSALCAALPDGAGSVGAFMQASSSLPYVVVEGIASQPLRTQDSVLDDCAVSCAVYSDQPGGAEARTLLRLLASALADELDIDGYHVVLQQPGNMQTQLMGDGLTYRAVFSLRVVIEQTEA